MTSLRKQLNRYEPASIQGLGQDIPEWGARGARVAGLIDFTSGLLVANIGHDRREIAKAVAHSRGWTSWYAPNRSRLAAYKALASILLGYKFVFLNSGSEAIDCAIKVCIDNGLAGVAQDDCYWGSTIGAVLLRSKPTIVPSHMVARFRQAFVGYNCLWTTQEQAEELIEQQKRGDVIVFDEMQAGFGRTGKWFGFQHLGIKPDIVVGGKAAAGGFPFAFVAGRPDLMDKNPLADYPSTFSANSFACDALVATIKIIKDEKLVRRAANLGEVIERSLSAMVGEGTVRQLNGLGMAWSVFPKDRTAMKVCVRCRERGLLVLDTGRGWIKIAPPLVIRESELERGLDILCETLREVA